MNCKTKYVPRSLLWIDRNGNEHSFCEKTLLADVDCPFVVLGDLGIGKTELMKMLEKSGDGIFFQAASFLRQRSDSVLTDSLLIIDGLDEVAAREDGDPLHNVLKKLIARGCPPFIVSCRTAEWNGAPVRLDIENEYGCSPKELTL